MSNKNQDKGNIGQLIAKEQISNQKNQKFNQEFEKEKEKRKEQQKLQDTQKLNNISAPEITKPIYKYSIGEIMIGIKNTWFEIFADLASFNIDNILTKNHRIFYIGLTFIIIGIILYLYEEFYGKIDEVTKDISMSDIKKNIIGEQKKEMTKYIDKLISKTIEEKEKELINKLGSYKGKTEDSSFFGKIKNFLMPESNDKLTTKKIVPDSTQLKPGEDILANIS